MLKLTIPYYQRLLCHQYYRDGVLVQLPTAKELLMIGFTENGFKCIVDDLFIKGDLLMLNIHIDRYPFEKLMCSLIDVETFGEMKELTIEVMGMPNGLHDKIRQYADQAPSTKGVDLSKEEQKILKGVLKKLL